MALTLAMASVIFAVSPALTSLATAFASILSFSSFACRKSLISL